MEKNLTGSYFCRFAIDRKPFSTLESSRKTVSMPIVQNDESNSAYSLSDLSHNVPALQIVFQKCRLYRRIRQSRINMWLFNSTVYRRHCKCRRIKDQRTEPLYAAAVSKSFAEMPSLPSFSADSLFFVSLCRLNVVQSHSRQYRYRRHFMSRLSYRLFKMRVSSEF